MAYVVCRVLTITTSYETDAVSKQDALSIVKEGKADKEIGGENYDQTVSDAKLALDTLGNEALGIVLEITGVGDNPDFLRMFAKVGRVMRNDGIDFGSAVSASSKAPGEVMYKDMS